MPSNGQFRPNASSHSIALKRLETEHSTSYATVCKWMELAFKANELLAILRRVLELLEIVPRSRTGRTSVNWRTMSSVKVAIIEFIWRTKKKNKAKRSRQWRDSRSICLTTDSSPNLLKFPRPDVPKLSTGGRHQRPGWWKLELSSSKKQKIQKSGPIV